MVHEATVVKSTAAPFRDTARRPRHAAPHGQGTIAWRMSTNSAPLSAIPETVWPAVPGPVPALLLALLQQFEQSERWPPELVEQRQNEQLQRLLAHAHHQSPFHRARLDALGYRPGQAITREFYEAIPVLTRATLQEHWNEIVCREVPKAHGRTLVDTSSGSSGTPIKIVKT